MTRFLSRALTELEGRSLNQETERMFAYHHATKHTYYSVRTGAHFLDWRNQPNPFRTYEGITAVPLAPQPDFPDAGTFATMAALDPQQARVAPSSLLHGTQLPLDARWLSRLLWHSMAISAWKLVPQSNYRYSLRVNPSSGNLHPTETHLAVAGFAGIEDGLYHYRVDAHALEQRGQGNWVAAVADALEIPWAARAPLIVALSSIFWREAWKYRDRAYRYCCHDLGHAMMSILLAARSLGLEGGVVAHFSDLRLARALGLAESDEAPMAFLIFDADPQAARQEISQPLSPPTELRHGAPNELSEEEVPYYLLLGMHRSTVLPEPAESSLAGQEGEMNDAGSEESGAAAPRKDAPLGAVVRRRRSALDFDPKTPPMDQADFEQLLDFAMRDWPADWRGNFGRAAVSGRRGKDFIELLIYVHRIRGLEPGMYSWSPIERRLVQLHQSDIRRVAAYLSLEQMLAGNACFAISMVANLEAAAKLFGNRGYRYMHFDAGAIGHRLYLGAEALGWNATGIGAFYDDDVHRYLGFLDEEEDQADPTDAAERAALVALAIERAAAAPARAKPEEDSRPTPTLSESHEEQVVGEGTQTEAAAPRSPRHDPRYLPRQVIYHFAVGRAVPDPRLTVRERQEGFVGDGMPCPFG